MSKSKAPCLSLGASGTIGQAISFKKTRGVDIAESKPIPFDRRTLSQRYQRWLYQDYIELWMTLPAAEKQAWLSAASRYHRTGVSHFLSHYLTHLPDIAAWWKFDWHSGAIAPDSSRNANTGTVIGALRAPGLLDGAYSFDGVNDHINCGNGVSLQITGDISVVFSVNGFAIVNASKWDTLGNQRSWVTGRGAGGGLSVLMTSAGAWAAGQRKQYESSIVAFDNTWHRAGFTFSAPAHTLYLYVDGVRDLAPIIAADDPITQLHNSTADLLISAAYTLGVLDNFWAGVQDDVRVYNRVLPDSWFARDYSRL